MWDAFNQPTFLFLKKTKHLNPLPQSFEALSPLHLFLKKIVILEKKSKSKKSLIELQDQLWKTLIP